jgi:hypothetical protein
VEIYLYLITEKASRHGSAQRGFSLPSPHITGFLSAPVVILQSGSTDSSRKLSDLFKGRVTDWEDMSRTPTTTNKGAAQGGESVNDRETETPEVPSGGSSTPETPALDRAPFGEPRVHPANGDIIRDVSHAVRIACSSPSSLSPERFLERTSLRTGTMILERLDELLLGHGSRGPAGSALVDDPPRKLLLSSQVLQMANSNTVKDRCSQ